MVRSFSYKCNVSQLQFVPYSGKMIILFLIKWKVLNILNLDSVLRMMYHWIHSITMWSEVFLFMITILCIQFILNWWRGESRMKIAKCWLIALADCWSVCWLQWNLSESRISFTIHFHIKYNRLTKKRIIMRSYFRSIEVFTEEFFIVT